MLPYTPPASDIEFVCKCRTTGDKDLIGMDLSERERKARGREREGSNGKERRRGKMRMAVNLK